MAVSAPQPPPRPALPPPPPSPYAQILTTLQCKAEAMGGGQGNTPELLTPNLPLTYIYVHSVSFHLQWKRNPSSGWGYHFPWTLGPTGTHAPRYLTPSFIPLFSLNRSLPVGSYWSTHSSETIKNQKASKDPISTGFLLSYYHFLLSPKEANCLSSFPVWGSCFSHPSAHCLLASISLLPIPLFYKMFWHLLYPRLTNSWHWEWRGETRPELTEPEIQTDH